MIRQVRAGRVAIVIALVAALVGATWLYHGYQFGQWPTPGLLVNVYRIDGQLQGDWFADLPPVHWTLAHAFGALPFSAVKPATLVVWLLSLSVLWGAVVSIGRSTSTRSGSPASSRATSIRPGRRSPSASWGWRWCCASGSSSPASRSEWRLWPIPTSARC
jgi:hypothetical protein